MKRFARRIKWFLRKWRTRTLYSQTSRIWFTKRINLWRKLKLNIQNTWWKFKRVGGLRSLLLIKHTITVWFREHMMWGQRKSKKKYCHLVTWQRRKKIRCSSSNRKKKKKKIRNKRKQKVMMSTFKTLDYRMWSTTLSLNEIDVIRINCSWKIINHYW